MANDDIDTNATKSTITNPAAAAAAPPPAQPSLPHQESWYLNAMEGGKGGVVYGEKESLVESLVESKKQNLHHHHLPLPPPAPPMMMLPKGQQQLLPVGSGDVVDDIMSTMPTTTLGVVSNVVVQSLSSSLVGDVGMPLSEMPSMANSLGPSSNAASDDDNDAGDNGEVDNSTTKQQQQQPNDDKVVAALKPSELQCNCLELIMPLPTTTTNNNTSDNNDDKKNNGSSSLQENHHPGGFGTKQLPNGTSVLVNYEKLLQNEATKRILLQRSVEAYEHTLTKLQNISHNQEIQLGEAHSTISSLKDMVQRLQDEKENMMNETQLFEAELLSVRNDKEYLEREVESMQEDFKMKENSIMHRCAKDMEGMKAGLLQESQAEKSRLIDQVEILQADLSEVQQESTRVGGERDLLRQERDQLNDKVEELMTAAYNNNSNNNNNNNNAVVGTTETASSTVEMEMKSLRNTVESLQQELHEKDGEIEQLNEERDQLNEKVRERAAASSTEMEALESRVETLQHQLLEKDGEIEQLNEERHQLNAKVEKFMNNTAALTETIAAASNVEIEELRSVVESLQEELLEKDDTIEQLNGQISAAALAVVDQQATSNDAPSAEHDKLRKEYDCLQNEFSETKSTVARLQDENESLQAMQRESGTQISELKATIESMDCDDFGEVDKLAAEVASLTYELGVKATECEESASALQDLQTKLDNAESRLVECNNAPSPPKEGEGNQTSEAEQSLRVENGLLKNQLADFQGACSLLEDQKSNLEKSLEEGSGTIQSLEMQIQDLHAQAMESATLQQKLSDTKKSLDDKVVECAESASALQLLQSKLDAADAQVVAFNETEQLLRAETSALNNQLVDLRGEHSSLVGQKSDLEKSLEEQVSAVQLLETQIQSLNTRIKESANLRNELSRVRKALDDKVYECQTIATSYEDLQTELLNTSSDRDVVLAKNELSADQAQEQISRLQSQMADLLKDHNATMKNVEEQLTNSLQENTTLRAQCEQYRKKLEEAEKDCANISHSTSETNAKYAEMISKFQGENLELSIALQTAQSALEEHQIEASGDNSQVKKLQRSIDTMKQEMDLIADRHQELLDKNHCLMQEKADIAHEKADITQSLEARASTAEQKNNLLQLECAELRSQLDGSQQASADATQTIADLKAQLQSLKDTNAELEDQLFDAGFQTPEAERLAEENASLRRERDELKEESGVLPQQVNELAALPSEGTFTSVEKDALLARIHSLEEELRVENLNELRDELTSLHEERQQLDVDNEELLVQLGLMQQAQMGNQAECEVEVETLREQVSTLEDKCNRLQNDLDELRRDSSLPGEKDHVKDLQDENNSLRHTISQLHGEKDTLEDQISDLTQKIEGLELQNSQIIKTLRQKLGLLELKLADKEEEVESTKKEMQSALDTKDKEIFKLTTECSSRENELSDMSSKLDEANNEMGTFSSQLETLQNHYEQDKYNQVHVGAEEEKVFEEEDDDISLQDLLAEAVLDSGDDYLRSQIVVLAQALERSELQRADALERIFSERKSNSVSLRQLGESVKRFYSTVRASDVV
ncbi:hypothetical protein ACHAXR_011238 [Thalassiosira sp. AJA248-18]